MSGPSTSIPSFLPPLHLYRHLLREVSYLPLAWRTTFSSTIHDRFHRHQKKDDSKAQSRRAKAYNVLCTLRAANGGDSKAMESLISKGFGRKGQRRRQLLTPFLHSGGPNDTKALEALLDGQLAEQSSDSSKTSETAPAREMHRQKGVFYEKWATPKLQKLLKSQRTVQQDNSAIWDTAIVKNLNPDQYVPKETMWGKPPVQSLVNSKRASWWRRAAEKAMPPLGEGEWDLLHRLSDGAQETDEWKIPERRIPARPLACDATDRQDDWDWKSYISKPINVVEVPRSAKSTLRTGQKDPGPYAPRKNQRSLSGRWYRRAYSRVWQQTPKMNQDPQSLGYSFEWGTAKSGLASPTEAQLEFFEGVDSKGQKLKKP